MNVAPQASRSTKCWRAAAHRAARSTTISPRAGTRSSTEALQYAGEAITEVIDEAATNGGMFLVRKFVVFWEELLVESNFTAGCPVVAAAIGSADEEPQLTTVAGSIFSHWRDALTRAFVSDGFYRRRRRIAGDHVHRILGGSRRVVPVHAQCRSAERCRRPARVPDQVKGIRAALRAAFRRAPDARPCATARTRIRR